MVGLQQDEVEVPQQVRYGSAKPKLVGSWLQGTEDVVATGWPMHFHGAKTTEYHRSGSLPAIAIGSCELLAAPTHRSDEHPFCTVAP